MTFGVFTLEWCFREGWDTGGYITYYIYSIPLLIWYLLFGLAFYSSDVYVQLLMNSYWISSSVSYVLQWTIADTHPHPECNNQGYANPAWEVQLAYHFVVLMIAHRTYWIRVISLADIARGLFLTVFTPAWLVINGNYTVVQAIMGAVAGSLVGLFCVQAIYLFWIDRLEILVAHPLIRRFGYKYTVAKFYNSGTIVPGQDMPDEVEGGVANEFLSPADKSKLESGPLAALKYPIRIDDETSRKMRQYYPVTTEFSDTFAGTLARATSTAFFGSTKSIFDG